MSPFRHPDFAIALTIDRLAGQALRAGIDMRDLLLVSSGRISSEMLVKARLMQIPIVASRTAPTRVAVELAQMWQVCVVGYVRQGGMRVYTIPGGWGWVIALSTYKGL
ncbi:MAG: formate dehydrogenase accessory sulfurtransferase FdhD [Anaerolineae bacterium]|nr:formate dehydrogenase accessory sulfurtransferase FdhD [Anaerolineae bacterium]